jgi:HEAT repeats
LDPTTRAPFSHEPAAGRASPFTGEGRAPDVGVPLDEEPQQAPGGLLSALPQFFVFPLILVATLTAAWLGLRLLMGGSTGDAHEALAEIRAAAGPHGRWQAMHELADGLRRGRLSLDDVPAAELAVMWRDFGGVREGAGPEEREQVSLTRQWLLQVLAWKRDPQLTAIAVGALADEDPRVRLSAVAALAEMRDPSTVDELAGVLDGGGYEERFVALGALARLAADGDAAAADAVAGQLAVADGVLHRNAVLALADAGDARAAAGLPALLVRANYEHDVSLDGPDAALRDEDSRAAARAEVVEQFLVQACRAAAKSHDPALGPLLRALEAGDPSLKVRSAALGALSDRGESPEKS